MRCIAFTGGGTGGHIYPGLAVAAGLRAAGGVRVIWIGSEAAFDREVVEKAGIRFFAIKSGKLRRYFSLKNLTDIFNIAAGYVQARRILRKERPALLFSKGGFVSVPPCIAARSLRIPAITHESDFSPGLATKINALFAAKVCLSYEESAAFFPRAIRRKTIHTGNPVREAFHAADRKRGFAFLGVPDTARVLLVLGGSQGAREVNQLVRAALPALTGHFIVAHQTGEADFAASAGLQSGRYRPFAYIKAELPDVLSCAYLVLGRAGAGTVWESAACGKPLVLIPLEGSGTRGDQVENARYFERQGAAVVLVHPDAARLAAVIKELADNGQRVAAMADASAKTGRNNAVKTICALLEAGMSGPAGLTR
jgi:UDP-N-acetylglucosamine--N-acetylmuramyl-(pentapeptide) pyrophosphoryl-undecaprenol N-acetylglucosamine transferase